MAYKVIDVAMPNGTAAIFHAGYVLRDSIGVSSLIVAEREAVALRIAELLDRHGLIDIPDDLAAEDVA